MIGYTPFLCEVAACSVMVGRLGGGDMRLLARRIVALKCDHLLIVRLTRISPIHHQTGRPSKCDDQQNCEHSP